jgi:hypothetical protein
MSIYTIYGLGDFALWPALLFGWDEDDDFYLELGWMNVGVGVVFE